MTEPILIAQGKEPIFLLPKMANRHGLIAGATGTGKTVTLQTLAEIFSAASVCRCLWPTSKAISPALSQAGRRQSESRRARQGAWDRQISHGEACPVVFWDVFGEQGHPVRATVSEMGPLLLGRLLDLNDTQAGVLNMVFKIADDNGLAPARSEGSARDAAVRRRQRRPIQNAIWKYLRRQRRSDPAQPARAGISREQTNSLVSPRSILKI